MVSLTRAEQLKAIREGGWTDRMHTVLKNRSYRVDGHSWGVAMLVHRLFPADCNMALLLAALYHDVPERWVGDSPHPAKYPLTDGSLGKLLKMAEEPLNKALGIEIQLTERERQILALCDILDLVLWAHEEVAMGNLLMKPTLENGMAGARGMALWPEIEKIWDEVARLPVSERSPWWTELMNGGYK